MNKKGFTLVELLAVIAILAILVIIALPNVLSMYNEAKMNTFTTEMRKLYSGVKEKWMLSNNGGQTYTNVSGLADNAVAISIDGSQTNTYYVKIEPSGKITRFIGTNGTYGFDITDTNGIEVQNIGAPENISEADNKTQYEIKTTDTKLEIKKENNKITLTGVKTSSN